MNREQVSKSSEIFSKILFLPLSAKITIVIIFFFVMFVMTVASNHVAINNILPALFKAPGKINILRLSAVLPGQSESAVEKESIFFKSATSKKVPETTAGSKNDPLLLDNSARVKIRVDQTPFFEDEYDYAP